MTIVALSLRPLDRADGADNLLIFERRTAPHAVPGEHELQSHVRVDTMPKEVPAKRSDGRIAPPSLTPSRTKLRQ